MTRSVDLTVNGEASALPAEAHHTLLEALRHSGLTGTKQGCDGADCGACTVLLDGDPVLACCVLALEAKGREVTTVEGLADEARLHPLQEAFADLGGSQCGYCTPAVLVTAKALLDRCPDPSREQIREALAGVICRCTGYQQIFESVEAAVKRGREAAGATRDKTTKVNS